MPDLNKAEKAVLGMLLERDGWVSLKEIYRRVHPRITKTELETILNTLVKGGFASKGPFGGFCIASTYGSRVEPPPSIGIAIGEDAYFDSSTGTITIPARNPYPLETNLVAESAKKYD